MLREHSTGLEGTGKQLIKRKWMLIEVEMPRPGAIVHFRQKLPHACKKVVGMQAIAITNHVFTEP